MVAATLKPPSSRSGSRLIITLLLLAVVAASGFGLWRWLPKPWQALPGGGRMRILKVEKVTKEQNTSVVYGGSILHRLNRRIPLRWQPLWARFAGPPLHTAQRSTVPGLAIWFVTRERGGVPSPYTHAVFTYPDGQRFREKLWPSVSTSDVEMASATLRVYPKSARHFSVRLESSDRAIFQDFLVTNPDVMTNVPHWTPSPLPQVQHGQEFEFRLLGVRTADFTDPNSNAPWQCGYSVKVTDINGRFFPRGTTEVTITDAEGRTSARSGVFSQPVWRVDVKHEATLRYPLTYSYKDRVVGGSRVIEKVSFYVAPPPPPTPP